MGKPIAEIEKLHVVNALTMRVPTTETKMREDQVNYQQMTLVTGILGGVTLLSSAITLVGLQASGSDRFVAAVYGGMAAFGALATAATGLADRFIAYSDVKMDFKNYKKGYREQPTRYASSGRRTVL